MVGLGESWDEILEVLYDLASWEVDILTIGQCLQPSRKHLTMDRFYPMEEFAKLRKIALEMGFNWVESAPLIRRSYHADKQVMALSLMW